MIHLSADRRKEASVGFGVGPNNFAEIKALDLLLYWLVWLGFRSVQIFGDSLNIVKWFNKDYNCQSYLLIPILEEIWLLKNQFTYISVSHIYRETNVAADHLSTVDLQQVLGSWKIRDSEVEGLVEAVRTPYI